ncbi:MAG: shikimate kinase [Pseudomonadota bacterium]
MTPADKNTVEPSPLAPFDKTVVLVGMMGVGKSTVGRRLAASLALPFHDADTEIETAAGMSVSDLFANHGEQSFRDGEERIIARLLDEGPMVLATGGGAIMREATRQRIGEKSISIWLRADIDVIVQRATRRNARPLLQTGDPRQTIKRLTEERTPFYAEADIQVESQPGPHQNTVDAILAALADHCAKERTGAQDGTQTAAQEE